MDGSDLSFNAALPKMLVLTTILIEASAQLRAGPA
jgi:hypothetical protein